MRTSSLVYKKLIINPQLITSLFNFEMEAPHFCFLAALTFIGMVTCYAKPPAPEDIGTNFFLKASKSVPRIGRRNMEYENYFLKASKSIPRIGRRTLSSSSENENSWLSKLSREPMKRSFFEKYFKESEQPVWSDLEKIYQDYPGSFQGEEPPYPAGLPNPKPDPYWPRTKKSDDILDEEPQSQE